MNKMVKGKGILLTSILLLALAMPQISSGQNTVKKKNIFEVIEEEQRKAEEACEELKQRIPNLKYSKTYGDSIFTLYKGALDYPVIGSLSSKFGKRKQPLEKNMGGSENSIDFHYGIDIAIPKKTPIKAPFNGEIIKGAYNKDLGWYIKLRLDSGLDIDEPILTFGHLLRLPKKYLNATEKNPINVKKGEWILETFNSGKQTTGPHLHYAIQIKKRFIDPQRLYDKRFKKRQIYGE